MPWQGRVRNWAEGCGVNLVVLSAATLQHLVDRKILTKEEAQRMLNEAKVGGRDQDDD